MLYEKEKEVRERFVPVFLSKLYNSKNDLFAVRAAEKAAGFHADFVKPVTEGGVFGALWELAEETKTGYEVDLKKFPIRQDVIEICELFRLNPYQMASGGCLLVILEDGRGFVESCKREGIMASVIGRMKAGKDKIILNGRRDGVQTVRRRMSGFGSVKEEHSMNMRTEILRYLEKNSRVDLGELAVLLGTDEMTVANEIAEMEKEENHLRISYD